MACPSVSVVPAGGHREGGRGRHWIPLQDGDDRTGPERSSGHVIRKLQRQGIKRSKERMGLKAFGGPASLPTLASGHHWLTPFSGPVETKGGRQRTGFGIGDLCQHCPESWQDSLLHSVLPPPHLVRKS